MADFAHKAATTDSTYLATIEEYDLYCHYVAGLVGEGLSRLWSASGKEAGWLKYQLDKRDGDYVEAEKFGENQRTVIVVELASGPDQPSPKYQCSERGRRREFSVCLYPYEEIQC